MQGRIIHSCCRKTADQGCHRTHQDHPRSGRNATGEHAGQCHIRHPRRRHPSNHDGWRTRRNDRQRHGRVRNGRRCRSRRMDGSMTMRVHLEHIIHHSSRRHSHNSPHSKFGSKSITQRAAARLSTNPFSRKRLFELRKNSKFPPNIGKYRRGFKKGGRNQ